MVDNQDLVNTLKEIFNSLNKNGYNAEKQLIGYLTTGELAYISNTDQERVKITKFDREEYISYMLQLILKGDNRCE